MVPATRAFVPVNRMDALFNQVLGELNGQVNAPLAMWADEDHFWVEAEMPDVPDKLEAAADKTSYRPGEVAKLFVKAPFAGQAEIAIASDRILSMRSLALPEGGTTV